MCWSRLDIVRDLIDLQDAVEGHSGVVDHLFSTVWACGADRPDRAASLPSQYFPMEGVQSLGMQMSLEGRSDLMRIDWCALLLVKRVEMMKYALFVRNETMGSLSLQKCADRRAGFEELHPSTHVFISCQSYKRESSHFTIHQTGSGLVCSLGDSGAVSVSSEKGILSTLLDGLLSMSINNIRSRTIIRF